MIIVVTSTVPAVHRRPRIKFDSMSGGNMGTSLAVFRKVGLFEDDPVMATAEDADGLIVHCETVLQSSMIRECVCGILAGEIRRNAWNSIAIMLLVMEDFTGNIYAKVTYSLC